MEMQSAYSGKSFLAITDQAGQQEVPMKGSSSGTSGNEVLRLLGGAEVGADGNLKDIGKAELLHGSTELAGGYLGSELADEGGSHSGDRPAHPTGWPG